MDTQTLVGKGIVLGDDVNTDELHPSRFYSLDDRRVREGFLGAVPGRQRDASIPGALVVLAGRNFGCGSSRETGARVFALAGVKAVVAASFARIFQRNLINLGLPALVCPALEDAGLRGALEGRIAEVSPGGGTLNIGGTLLALEPLDPLHASILDAGGLIPYLGLGR